jgi:small-conductance mechanosensitive channel
MFQSSLVFDLFDRLGIDSATLTTWTYRITGLVIVWAIVYVLVRYLSRWITHLDEHSAHLEVNPRDLKTVDRLLDYVIILIGLIVSLAVLGWTSLLYSALTAAGLFSVIIGFAVKDVASNFISGIVILIDQPFAPGDYIEIGDYSGTVRDISLRSTALTTPDGPVVYIPNSILAVEPTINYSIAEDRRISFPISIANEADIGRAIEIIRQVLEDEAGLLAERPQSVRVDEVREYAVDIGVTCYAPNDTWLDLSSELKQQVVNALQENGIELAVPVRKYVNLDRSATQT